MPSGGGVALRASEFGTLVDTAGQGVSVQKFTWKTQAGLQLSVLNLDAAIIELCAPGLSSSSKTTVAAVNVILGTDSLDEYLQLDPSLICAARLEHTSPLRTQAANLSGRLVDPARIWLPFVDGNRLQLSREASTWPNHHGKLVIATITITVEPSNVVHIQYRTSCTSGGLFRLSHCLLVNLAGKDAGPAGTYDHVVQLNADSYIDGQRFLRSAPDNLADLRVAQHLGLVLYKARDEGSKTETVDGIYSLNNASGEGGFALRLIHTGSGRALELYCASPWMHFSTLDQLPEGRNAIVPFYPRHGGLRRLSLVFDIERFVVAIVDAIERKETSELGQQSKEKQIEKNQTQEVEGRFVRHAGLLLHPVSCPYKITGSIVKERHDPGPARLQKFYGEMKLKFGTCKPIEPRAKARAQPLRQYNRIGTNEKEGW